MVLVVWRESLAPKTDWLRPRTSCPRAAACLLRCSGWLPSRPHRGMHGKRKGLSVEGLRMDRDRFNGCRTVGQSAEVGAKAFIGGVH